MSFLIASLAILPTGFQKPYPLTKFDRHVLSEFAVLKREGLLVGYIDGLADFRDGFDHEVKINGTTMYAASRYEYAVGVHATLENLRYISGGLLKQLRSSGGHPDKSLATNLSNIQGFEQARRELSGLLWVLKPELVAMGGYRSGRQASMVARRSLQRIQRLEARFHLRHPA